MISLRLLLAIALLPSTLAAQAARAPANEAITAATMRADLEFGAGDAAVHQASWDLANTARKPALIQASGNHCPRKSVGLPAC